MLIKPYLIKNIIANNIITHGITDIDCKFFPLVYTAVFSLPLSKKNTHNLFYISSYIHFSYDIGYKYSLFLHLLVPILCSFNKLQLAMDIMIVYLSLFHVPMHYLRCFNNERYFSIIISFLLKLLMCFINYDIDFLKVIKNQYIKKIIISHVIVELLV